MTIVHTDSLHPQALKSLAVDFGELAARTYAHGLVQDAAHDRQCAAEMLEQMASSEGKCLLRSHFPAHLTGSLLVVSPDGRHTLLTHHRKLGKWLQLGGHLDAGELPKQAALREAEEESGFNRSNMLDTCLLDLDMHPIPARATEPGHMHFDVCYAAVLSNTEPVQPVAQEDESHEVRWVPLAELTTFTTEESLLRKHRKLERLLAAGLLRARSC